MSIKKYSSGQWVDTPYRKYETATDTITTLPKTIIGDGQPISAYTIKGNMQQSGTPTPSNPIYPSECGEMTKNLLKNDAVSTEFRGVQYTVNADKSVTVYGTASPMISYCILMGDGAATNDLNAYTKPIFKAGDTLKILSSGRRLQARNTDGTYTGNLAGEVTLSKDIGLIYIQVVEGTTADETVYPMITLSTETDTDYEPYGYKLPITLNNNTYPVYLSEPIRKIGTYVDSVSSTGTVSRVFKKLVLTGNESGWTMGASQVGKRFGYNVSDTVESNTSQVNSILSHLPLTVSGGTNDYPNTYAIGADKTLLIVLDSTYTSLDQFKDWLRGQYQNGTPVTLWYRSSSSTTESFTAPTLPTSGTAETFDVATTLKPSEVSLTYHGWHEHSDTKFTE